LQPLALGECEELIQAKGLGFSREQIVEAYMTFGGIPYYLDLLKRRMSLSQNIDFLCFNTSGQLRSEFDELYASLFSSSGLHRQVVEALAKKRKGLARAELEQATGLKSGGTLTTILEELELSDFIRSYKAFNKHTRNKLYQLSDSFSLFYLTFMRKNDNDNEHYWTNSIHSGRRNAWNGYAFEQVCLAHVSQVKAKLGISGVLTKTAAWRSSESDPGAQIDLVIERSDGIINLCEVKYAEDEYEITKAYDSRLREKREAFRRETGTRKALHQTFITTYGVKHNAYWNNVQSEVTFDDLFR
jgi:hypothetical protein